MSSDWVKFRDNLLNNLKFDNVDEKMKNDLTLYISNVIMPLVKKSADSFLQQIKEQSVEEKGWLKVRDLIILPFIISAGLWLIDKTLTETIKGVQLSEQ